MAVARLAGVAPGDDRSAIRRYLAREAAGQPFEQTGQRIRLGEYMVRKGAITREQLLHALINREIGGGRLGDAIVRLGYCTRWLVEQFAKKHRGGRA